MSVSSTRIFFVLGLGIIAVSFASIIIRLTPAPTLVIAAGRMVFASLMLSPFFLLNLRAHQKEFTRAKLRFSLFAGIFLAAHFGFWIESLRHTTVASSVLLVALNPVFVALMSPFLLREKLNLRLYLAIGLGVIGAIIINRPGLNFSTNLAGNLLAIAGAFFAALYCIIGRKLRPGLSLLGYVYPVYLIAALILFLFAIIAGYPLTSYPIKTYLLILLLAIGPQVIGHTSFNWALGYLPASVVVISILGEPIGTTILAAILLNQLPTWFELIGGILILGAIYLAALSFSTNLAHTNKKTGAPV
ncbi:MAG: DMT family transporter [bacterium]